MNLDLNNYQINTDGHPLDPEDYSVKVSDCDLEVVFRNQKKRLLKLIRDYPYVCGCVAWLTDMQVLSAMADMKHVSIIVQKEDFLRPDLNNSSDFYMNLRKAYESLPTTFGRLWVEGLVGRLSMTSDYTLDSIRCMGNHNSDKNQHFPVCTINSLYLRKGFHIFHMNLSFGVDLTGHWEYLIMRACGLAATTYPIQLQSLLKMLSSFRAKRWHKHISTNGLRSQHCQNPWIGKANGLHRNGALVLDGSATYL